MSAEVALHLQCARCGLHFSVKEESLAHAAENVGGSDEDFCCPLCRHTNLLVFVEVENAD